MLRSRFAVDIHAALQCHFQNPELFICPVAKSLIRLSDDHQALSLVLIRHPGVVRDNVVQLWVCLLATGV